PRGGRKHPQDDFLQIDTANILFICGGAFSGIEQIVERRLGGSSMGFGAQIKDKSKAKYDRLVQQTIQQDLVHYGLIPELVGRMPVIAALEELDATALVRILSEPRNALLKQYCQLFSYDGVELELDHDALVAVAEKTLEKQTGARGLRSVMEQLLQPLMYSLPSDPAVERVLITGPCVTEGAQPQLERNPAKRSKPKVI
ncbi:MAG: AAA family ATPase, partial [Oscillospiraceae bacterium]|nr:AAA family ATPase [Oscillospiraceae bacterium]